MMKKFLLLSLTALSLCTSFTSNAYTNAQIAAKGKAWIAVYEPDLYFTINRKTYQYTSNIPMLKDGDLNVSLDSSSGLLVIDMPVDPSTFGVNSLELLVDVQNTTATIMNNAYVQPIGTGENINNSGRIYEKTVKQHFQMLAYINGYYYGIIPRTSSSPTINQTHSDAKRLTGTVSYNSKTDQYVFDFGAFDVVKIYMITGYACLGEDTNNNGTLGKAYYYYSNYQYFKRDSFSNHNGMHYETYSPNATIEDTEYSYNNNSVNKSSATPRSYSANVKFTDNIVEIENWSNLGQASVPYIDSEGIYCNSFQKFNGTIDRSNLNVLIKPTEIMTGSILDIDDEGYLCVSIINMSAAHGYDIFNDLYSAIEGQLKGNLVHVTNNKWIEENGKTVIKNPYIEFEPYLCIDSYKDGLDFAYGYVSYYDNTKVKLNEDFDYTHSVDIDVEKAIYNKVGWDGDFGKVLWVRGAINPESIKNSYFVDHYELYLKPGKVTDINTARVDDENGLEGAMNISDEKYFTAYDQEMTKLRPLSKSDEEIAQEKQDAIEANQNGFFNRFVTDRDMEAAGLKPSKEGDYTLFLKTVYTDNSGLKPTFHALTYLGEDITTVGVEDVIDDDSDANAPAVFYNMNGVRMNGDNLAPGLYIRRQGNTATKVVVK